MRVQKHDTVSNLQKLDRPNLFLQQLGYNTGF
jgi:hypothetical protein